MAILLIGGYPKGYDVPFHPDTRSGKILRKIILEHNIDAKIMDIWDDEEQEKAAVIYSDIIDVISDASGDCHIVALGRWVENALIRHNIKCIYLPHPASWQPNDRPRLISGLIELNSVRCD